MSPSVQTVSVVIAWRNRPEIGVSLRGNARYLGSPTTEVIVVNCGGDREMLCRALAETGLARLRALTLPAPVFNKSLALNVGVAGATGEAIVFLDADIILAEDFLALASARLDGANYITIERVAESAPVPASLLPEEFELANSLEIRVPGGRAIVLETRRIRPHDGTRAGPGLVALQRQHFLAVNGMNSHLIGWGWEDLDLLARLQFELGLRRVAVGRALHLSHGDQSRTWGEGSRTENEQSNYLTCLENYIAGNFHGTFREDVARWKPLREV